MKTKWPNVAKRAPTQPVSWISCRSLGWEWILKSHLPQSESSLGPKRKTKKGRERLGFIIMLYLLWWLHNACFCHVAEMFWLGETAQARILIGQWVTHCTLLCLRHPVGLLGPIWWTRVIRSSETHISPVAIDDTTHLSSPRLPLWHLLFLFMRV